MRLHELQQKLLAFYHFNKISFLTFLLAGIGTTAIYVGMFSFLWYVLHTNHVIAASVAFACSATFQFFTNRKVTFKVKEGRLTHQVFKYFSLLLINYLISLTTLQLSLWLVNSPLPGVAASVCIMPITGYLLFRYWVFRRPRMLEMNT